MVLALVVGLIWIHPVSGRHVGRPTTYRVCNLVPCETTLLSFRQRMHHHYTHMGVGFRAFFR